MLSKDSEESCINKWSGGVLIEDLIEEFRRRYTFPDDAEISLELLDFFKKMLASEERDRKLLRVLLRLKKRGLFKQEADSEEMP